MNSVMQGLLAPANQDRRLTRVFSTYTASNPSIYLDIDREKFRRLHDAVSSLSPQQRHCLHLRVEGLDGRLEAPLLPHRRLGLVPRAPELGGGRLVVELRYAQPFAGDVKDAPGESPGGSPTSSGVPAAG